MRINILKDFPNERQRRTQNVSKLIFKKKISNERQNWPGISASQPVFSNFSWWGHKWPRIPESQHFQNFPGGRQIWPRMPVSKLTFKNFALRTSEMAQNAVYKQRFSKLSPEVRQKWPRTHLPKLIFKKFSRITATATQLSPDTSLISKRGFI